MGLLQIVIDSLNLKHIISIPLLVELYLRAYQYQYMQEKMLWIGYRRKDVLFVIYKKTNRQN